jgi:hypothetical protein
MRTEALIRELAAQVRPVRPVGHPLARFAGWAAVAAVWIAAGVSVVGIRTDFAPASRAPGFVLDIVLPLALGLAATLAAFVASVPGRNSRWWTLIPAAVVASWLALVLVGALSTGSGHVGAGVRCIRNLAAFSVPPGLLLYLMLRKAAPLDRGTVGMLAAGGMSALAHVGTRFVCHNDGALHVLAWHCSFVLLLGAVGILVGRALFR